MTKIIITGSKGRMGQALVSCAKNFRELQVVAQIDVGDDLPAAIAQGDVVIDFSSHTATADIAGLCARHKKAIVIGTTGHTNAETVRNFEIQNENSDGLGLELFHRREHAVLADAQSGGDSGAGLRFGNRRNASPSENGRAERHGQNRWRKFWPRCASSISIKVARHGRVGIRRTHAG